MNDETKRNFDELEHIRRWRAVRIKAVLLTVAGFAVVGNLALGNWVAASLCCTAMLSVASA